MVGCTDEPCLETVLRPRPVAARLPFYFQGQVQRQDNGKAANPMTPDPTELDMQQR